jgi:hypothetical protein
MRNDPIHGKTLIFRFEDGPMKGKAFEHKFTDDDQVTYRALDGDQPSAPAHCEIARITDDVYAVSYLGTAGYTLTSILDFSTHRLTGFASNEQSLVAQHGRF